MLNESTAWRQRVKWTLLCSCSTESSPDPELTGHTSPVTPHTPGNRKEKSEFPDPPLPQEHILLQTSTEGLSNHISQEFCNQVAEGNGSSFHKLSASPHFFLIFPFCFLARLHVHNWISSALSNTTMRTEAERTEGISTHETLQ